MAAPVPQSKAHEAFQQLVKLRANGGEVDPFSYARFERAANASVDVDPISAHQVLGILASTNWDVAGTRRHFQLAISAGGGHVATANLGRALRDMNFLDEAAECDERAADEAPEQLLYLREAISNRLCIGNWSRAIELMEILAQRVPELSDDHNRAIRFIEFSRSIGLRDETVHRSVEIALNLLREEKTVLAGVADNVDDMSDEGAVYYDLYIRGSEDRAKELDDLLTPRLFAGIDDPQLSVFGLQIKALPNETE